MWMGEVDLVLTGALIMRGVFVHGRRDDSLVDMIDRFVMFFFSLIRIAVNGFGGTL